MFFKKSFIAWLTTRELVVVLIPNASVKFEEAVMEAKSMHVYSLLLQTIPESLQHLVQHLEAGDAIGVWNVLVAKYERKSAANKSHV